jgi:hypothetical protein
MAQTPCLLEVYRNAPSETEAKSCLIKVLLVHASLYRQAKRENQRLLDEALPKLWILTPSASDDFLEGFPAKLSPQWMPGIYVLGRTFKTAIVAINQLPTIEDTLWIRLLGNGRTQQQAISEVLAFPADDPR